MAQHGKGGFVGSIEDLYQVALAGDGDIADTRMPCQGPAYIQHSQTTEQAFDLERGSSQQMGIVVCYIGYQVHLRLYPDIA